MSLPVTVSPRGGRPDHLLSVLREGTRGALFLFDRVSAPRFSWLQAQDARNGTRSSTPPSLAWEELVTSNPSPSTPRPDFRPPSYQGTTLPSSTEPLPNKERGAFAVLTSSGFKSI
eukprot:GGOE01031790.1.p3 GENE.GGOE01031790.1~~GGOE01031790.1.p3  ORF type:complete len:116 (-),score=5.37 GGOE01031790.1:298-645(-)